MKVYIKSEIYINRKPNILDEFFKEQYQNYEKECGMFIVKMQQLFELCVLIKDLINWIALPNIHTEVLPIDNTLIVTLKIKEL